MAPDIPLKILDGVEVVIIDIVPDEDMGMCNDVLKKT